MMANDDKRVPPDFPRQPCAGSVAGFQAKLALRLVDGEFVEGLTDEELYERYDACLDLVAQLTAYCRRKLIELPATTVEALLPRVRKGVENKGWELTPDELTWVMCTVSDNLKPPHS